MFGLLRKFFVVLLYQYLNHSFTPVLFLRGFVREFAHVKLVNGMVKKWHHVSRIFDSFEILHLQLILLFEVLEFPEVLWSWEARGTQGSQDLVIVNDPILLGFFCCFFVLGRTINGKAFLTHIQASIRNNVFKK